MASGSSREASPLESARKRQKTFDKPTSDSATPISTTQTSHPLVAGGQSTTNTFTAGVNSTVDSDNMGNESSKFNVDAFQSEREIAVGISRYINETNPGFNGILKQRYTDFLVNEITPDGKVVHLTDTKAPKEPAAKRTRTEQASHAEENHASSAENMSSEKQQSAATSPPAVVNGSTSVEVKNDASDVVKAEAGVAQATSDVEGAQVAVPLPASDTADARSTDGPLELTSNDIALLESFFGPEIREQSIRMYHKVLTNPDAKPFTFGSLFSQPIADREIRTKMHADVRRIFKGRLETAYDEDGMIKISAARRSVGQDNRPGRAPATQGKGKLGWNELGGEYLHFTMYKENKDTMEIVSFLGATTKTPAKAFNFAGTKDRRACTAQRISVHRMRAEFMGQLNKRLFNAQIGDFKYEKFGLSLGYLLGNEFTITLRDCRFPYAGLNQAQKVTLANLIVGNAMKSLQQHGFVNYFGLQRFGTYRVGTQIVGMRILQNDYEGAVNAILQCEPEALEEASKDYSEISSNSLIPRDEVSRARAISSFKETGRSHPAIDILPRKFSAEKTLINHLSRNNSRNDFPGALRAITRNLRLMYVHAYQSLVWNVIASERLARYGTRVIKGDLVLINSKDAKAEVPEALEEVDEDGEEIVRPSGNDAAVTRDQVFERARALSEEEASSGTYSIYDVVLPQPGFDVEYPDNDIGDFYREFMGSEAGGNLDPADMRRNISDFSLSGSYRKLVGKIGDDASYEIRTYVQENEQLVQTDLEKLNKSMPGRGPRFEPGEGHNQTHGQNNHGNTRGDRGHRGGRGNSRGRGGRGNRGGYGNGRSGNYEQRGWTPVTPCEAQQHTGAHMPTPVPTTEPVSEPVVPDIKPIMNAWNNFHQKAQEEESALAAATAAERAAGASDAAKRVFKLPSFNETWIEKEPALGQRTGRREVQVFGGDGAGDEEDFILNGQPKPAEDFQMKNTGEEAESAVTLETNSEWLAGGSSDLAVENAVHANTVQPIIHSEASNSHANGDVVEPNGELKKVESLEEERQKIAVIVKFKLGSSQYATMALRELMKQGGVKAYKPEFSTEYKAY